MIRKLIFGMIIALCMVMMSCKSSKPGVYLPIKNQNYVQK